MQFCEKENKLRFGTLVKKNNTISDGKRHLPPERANTLTV